MRRGWWAAYRPDDGLDGLGGGSNGAAAPAYPGEEEIPDGSVGEGPEEVFSPLPPQPPTATAEADPWEGFDDETRAIAEKKGWKTPADGIKSYAELESLQGRRSQEDQQRFDELQRELRELQQQVRQPQRPQQQSQSDDPLAEIFAEPDFQEIERVAQGDPITAMQILYGQVVVPQMKAGLATLGQELVQHLGGQVEQVGGQVQQLSGTMSIKDQANRLVREYGSEFAKHADATERLWLADKALQQHPKGLELAFEAVYARDQLTRQRAARGNEGEALVGGRTPQSRSGNQAPRDPKAEIRAAIGGAIGFTGGDGLS